MVQLFVEHTTYDEKTRQWTTRLPFIPGTDLKKELGTNLQAALAISRRVHRKLANTPSHAVVDKLVRDLMKEDYVRAVTEDELKMKENVHYMSTLLVKKDSSTSPIRLCNDCSAITESSKSLNQLLLQGPTLLPSLADNITLFRLNQYAVVADLRKFFYSIRLAPEHQHYARFLYQFEGDKEPTHLVFQCLVFGMTSSPSLSVQALRLNCDRHAPPGPTGEMVKELANRLYVDDLSTSFRTLKEGRDVLKETISTFERGNFHLRKFQSSHRELLRDLPPEHCLPEGEHVRILGVEWDPSEDSIIFNLVPTVDVEAAKMQDGGRDPSLHGTTDPRRCEHDVDTLLLGIEPLPAKITKRTISSQVGKLFDPLGFLSPYVNAARVSLQNCWRGRLNWDEEVDEEIAKEYVQWAKNLHQLQHVRVPRFLSLPQPDHLRLLCFADASGTAAAAVIYLVSIAGKQTRSELLASRSKMAPVKGGLSICRLELLAMVIGSKLLKHYSKLLDIADVTLFTDSMTSLLWTRNRESQKQKMWVRNRTAQITRIVPVDRIRYCYGSGNPADAPSRPVLDPVEIPPIWWHGPSWARLSEEFWPDTDNLKALTPEQHEALELSMAQELQKYEPQVYHTTEPLATLSPWEQRLIARFPSWTNLCNIIGWVFRFIARARKSGPQVKTSFLTSKERAKASFYWLRRAQLSAYPALSQLGNKGLVEKEVIKGFYPFFDEKDKVYRSATRLQEIGELRWDERNPIILPKKSRLVELYVLNLHTTLGHAGRHTLLGQLRRLHALEGSRRELSRILHLCPLRGQGLCVSPVYITPRQGELPPERGLSPPYTFCALDAAGPLYYDDRGKKTVCYIYVFSDFSTRAVSAHLVRDLSAVELIRVIREFSALRAPPKYIFSDNAKAHGLAKKTLYEKLGRPNPSVRQVERGPVDNQDFLNSDFWKKVQDHCAKNWSIEWCFSTPRSPWKNSLVERAVGHIKSALRKMLGNKLLSWPELYTVLQEAVYLTNLRPLGVLSTDGPDSVEETPVSPLQLITGRTHHEFLPPEADRAVTLASKPIEAAYRERQKILNKFWRTWFQLYLQELAPNNLWSSDPEFEVKVGMRVLVKDWDAPRGKYPLATVVQTSTGRDFYHNKEGEKVYRVRSAQVKMKETGKLLWRPINCLGFLEGRLLLDAKKHGSDQEKALFSQCVSSLHTSPSKNKEGEKQ